MADQQAGATSLAPRRHAAVFGDGADSLSATATAVFEAARDSGAALLLMADEPDRVALDALPGRDDLLAGGRLRLLRTIDAYPHRDPVRLITAFDEVLRGALADGWTGIRVVAENTSMVTAGDDAFSDWLAWEHVTTRWQRTNPVVGVCWFDRTALDPEQVAPLASVHAEHHGLRQRVPFRLLTEGDGAAVVGDVDADDVAALVRLLGAVPHGGDLVVDLSRAGYVHHTVFPALELAPFAADRVRLVGARQVLHRVWDALGRPAGRVDLV